MKTREKILLFLWLFISFNAFSATYSTINSGDWSETTTWSGGIVPPTTFNNNDIVNINNGHSVSSSSSFVLNNNCTFNVDGELTITGDFEVNNNFILNVTGTFTLNGSFTGKNNAAIDINGSFGITGDCNINNNANIDVDGSLNIGGDFTGGSNNNLTGSGEVNVDGSVSGIDDSAYSGEVNQGLSPPVGLTNYGSVIYIGTNAVIYVDGDANGNYTNRTENDNAGAIELDGYLIAEGNLNNNAFTDSIFTRIDDDGEVKLNGTSVQNIGGSQPVSFEKLTVNNASGVTLDENIIINELLTLTSGIITTGDDTVIVSKKDHNAIASHCEGNSINGNLRRYMNAAEFSFPMSTASQYLEAVINITNIASLNYMECNFTESNSETVPDGLSIDGTAISHFLDYGYWTFTPDNGTDVVYDITLTSRGHSNGGSDPEQHAIFKRDAGDWESVGTHSTGTQNGTGTDPITAKRTNVTGFSDFIIGVGENPLLTELIAFEALCRDDFVEIKWQTASELNNDYFTLEKSKDGNDFEPETIIKGAGNSFEIKNYTHFDYNPYPYITYYRLKQTDFNGNSTYSGILAVECNTISFDILGTLLQYENGELELFLLSEYADQYQIDLYDILGRKIFSKKFSAEPGENRLSIEMNSLSNNIYLLNIANTYHQISKKIYIK